jgi:hypothetical protein
VTHRMIPRHHCVRHAAVAAEEAQEKAEAMAEADASEYLGFEEIWSVACRQRSRS